MPTPRMYVVTITDRYEILVETEMLDPERVARGIALNYASAARDLHGNLYRDTRVATQERRVESWLLPELPEVPLALRVGLSAHPREAEIKGGR